MLTLAPAEQIIHPRRVAFTVMYNVVALSYDNCDPDPVVILDIPEAVHQASPDGRVNEYSVSMARKASGRIHSASVLLPWDLGTYFAL